MYNIAKGGVNMKKTISVAFLLVMILGGTTVSASDVNPDGKQHPCMNGPCFTS